MNTYKGLGLIMINIYNLKDDIIKDISLVLRSLKLGKPLLDIGILRDGETVFGGGVADRSR